MKHLIMCATVALATLAANALPKVIGHRGESVDAPENTMSAYRAAMQNHTDGFEIDIYLTYDGQIVCFHDSTMQRVTREKDPRRIVDCRLDELRALDFGYPAKWGDKFKGEKIPTFDEALSLCKDGREIYIEVKTGPEIVPEIKKAFARNPQATPDKVLFISFNGPSIETLARELPAYRGYWLTGFSRNKETGATSPTIDQVIAKAKRYRACGVDFAAYDKETWKWIKPLHEAGLSAHAWTIDDIEVAKGLTAAGIDTITSNSPTKIKKALEEAAK